VARCRDQRETAIDEPLKASVNGPVVVVWGERGVSIGLTPEAVLDTLEPLREAAELAMRNRARGQTAE